MPKIKKEYEKVEDENIEAEVTEKPTELPIEYNRNCIFKRNKAVYLVSEKYAPYRKIIDKCLDDSKQYTESEVVKLIIKAGV